MAKKQKIDKKIQAEMGADWIIEIGEKPFIDGKGGNMPALGYACAACGSKDTKLRFAQSTDEEESTLEWMELQCKNCRSYTLYKKK